MGYDLYAVRPRGVDSHFYMGAFSFSWMMDAGVGLPISHGPAMDPGTHSYVPDKKGRSPACNDGYHVGAAEAKAMGMAAIGLADTQAFVNEEWAKLDPEEAEQRKRGRQIGVRYRTAVREDFIAKARAFGEWALKSGGFRIR